MALCIFNRLQQSSSIRVIYSKEIPNEFSRINVAIVSTNCFVFSLQILNKIFAIFKSMFYYPSETIHDVRVVNTRIAQIGSHIWSIEPSHLINLSNSFQFSITVTS